MLDFGYYIMFFALCLYGVSRLSEFLKGNIGLISFIISEIATAVALYYLFGVLS